ncbi:hypothetical protein EJB05_54810, partial [Eragrostis curvula]
MLRWAGFYQALQQEPSQPHPIPDFHTGAMPMHCFLPVLLSLSLLVTTTNGDEHIYIDDCPGNASYTPGSAFQANLDALLSTLPGAAAASSGFAKNATGAAPDQAYGLAQCRGDVNASACRSCLDASVRDVTRGLCRGQKSAMVIYDACQLRYSNASFFGVSDNKSFTVFQCSAQNATQPEQLMRFVAQVGDLLVNLTGKAAYRSPRMFAAAAVQVTPSVKLYGMVQCTRDLAADDCNRCLSSVVPFMPFDCEGKQSVRMFRRSCSARLEVFPFYNAQVVEAAMSPAPAPEGGPVNCGGRHANRSEAMIKVARCMFSLLLAMVLAI